MNYRAVVRPLTLGLVATLATPLAASLGAQTPLPSYGPLSARYRATATTQATRVMQGQTMEGTSTATQLTTVVIAKEASGLTFTMTLDSVAVTSTTPEMGPDPSGAVGMKLIGAMAPDGVVSNNKVTDKSGSPTDSPLAANMRSFMPRLKVGGTPGATWSDTANVTRPQGGGTVTTAVVNNFTLVGDTTVAGARAWKIVAVSVGTVSGNGNEQGAAFTITGSINGGGTFVVGAGGALVAADLASTFNMMVDVPIAGLQIPITQKVTTTIARVP